MKGFTPTAESHGFSPDLFWSGLRSGCRATKSRRSRSESAKLTGATGFTDNDWYAYLTLLKRDWLKAKGLRQKATKSNWTKFNPEIHHVLIIR